MIYWLQGENKKQRMKRPEGRLCLLTQRPVHLRRHTRYSRTSLYSRWCCCCCHICVHSLKKLADWNKLPCLVSGFFIGFFLSIITFFNPCQPTQPLKIDTNGFSILVICSSKTFLCCSPLGGCMCIYCLWCGFVSRPFVFWLTDRPQTKTLIFLAFLSFFAAAGLVETMVRKTPSGSR